MRVRNTSIRRRSAAAMAVTAVALSALWGTSASAAITPVIVTAQIGTDEIETAWGIAVDGAGNTYVLGDTYGALASSTSTGRVFVAKFDSRGTKVWLTQFGSTGSDGPGGIAVDGTHVFVAGQTNGAFAASNADLDPDGWAVDINASTGAVTTMRQYPNTPFRDIAVSNHAPVALGQSSVVVLDAATLAAATTTAFAANAHGIDTDASGNIYVAGTVSGGFAGLPYIGDSDGVLAKYNPSMTLLWANVLGTDNIDALFGLSVDSSGNAYVAGFTAGTLTGQTSAGGDTDVMVTKLSTNGNVLWERQFGSAAADSAFAVAASDQGALVVGTTTGTLPGQTAAGSGDAFQAWLSADGSTPDITQFGTAQPDDAYAAAITSTRGLVTAGGTFGQLGVGHTSTGGELDVDAFVRFVLPPATTTITPFARPVDGGDVWNSTKGGATVPLKFTVTTNGTVVSDPTAVTFAVTAIACPNASAIIDPLPLTTSASTSLRFDATTQQFVQTWQTPKTAGRCYEARVSVAGATPVTAKFLTK